MTDRHLVAAPRDSRVEGGLLPTTVPESARLLTTRPTTPGHTEHWSNWRRRQQARARWYHQRTRLSRDPIITLVR